METLKLPKGGLQKAPLLKGNVSSFTKREISESIMKNKILSCYIETLSKCNLKCPFCYTHNGNSEPEERSLSLFDMKSITDVAMENGAKSVIIAGKGEPLMDPALLPLMEYVTKKGLWAVVFSNCTLMTDDIARKLLSLNVTVIAKLGSLVPKQQDYMVGVEGAHERIWNGLKLLLKVGFKQPRLGADVTILRSNLNEMENIWRYLRERQAIPYLEPLIVEGRALGWGKLSKELPSRDEIHSLYKRLRELDIKEFGYDLNIEKTRTPGTPGCEKIMRPLLTLTVKSNGDVSRCVNSPTHNLGNIFEKGKNVTENLRRILRRILPATDNIFECCKGCQAFLNQGDENA